MDYITDRPINGIEDDLLGRAMFSQQLGEAIYSYSGKESIAIGLFGEWGTGKTSVANMALQTVEKMSKDKENSVCIIRFSPWHYSDGDNLISQFFSTLHSDKVFRSNKEKLDSILEAIDNYSDCFDFVEMIPVIGKASYFLKGAIKVERKKRSKEKNLEEAKKRLESILLEIGQRIVVLIDDIDRLTNSQIRDIFQLVKQVGDLPYITYLLVMDRDIVSRALEKVHDTDGKEYLEKIIQIPFEMPALRQSKVYDIFFQKLDKVVDTIPVKTQLDMQYWRKIFEYCISPYLHTLRDVNRVINTFQFKYSLLHRETSIEDMIGITTLEVLVPSLYKWISENKENVCGGTRHSLTTARKKEQELKNGYEEDFRTLGLEPEKAMKSVASLFPIFAKDVNVSFPETAASVNIREQMRAALPERFDLYFVFDMETVKVPRMIVRDCINHYEEDELRKHISDINKQGNIVYLLEEIQALIDRIPKNRLAVLAYVLLELQGAFSGEIGRGIFTFTAKEFAINCAQKMIKKIEKEEERFAIFQRAISNPKPVFLAVVARELRHIEHAYGRHTDEAEDKDNQIISIEHLNSLEQGFLSRVRGDISFQEIFDGDGSLQILFLWEDLDKDGAQAFLNSFMKDDVQRLKLFCKFAGRWTGSRSAGWSFDKKNYSEYFTDEDIYQTISKYDKTKMGVFNEEEQIKLASFMMNYQKSEFERVDDNQAKAVVDEWMSYEIN